MLERDFINATDLRSVQMALHSLKQVIPENSKVIQNEEHKRIIRTLKTWEEELYKEVQNPKI